MSTQATPERRLVHPNDLVLHELRSTRALLALILQELARGDHWKGSAFYRDHEQGGDVRRIPSNTVPTKLIDANKYRRELLVFNESTAVLYVLYGKQVTTVNYTAQVAASGLLVIDNYVGPVWGVWASQNGAAQITEV